MDNKKLIPLRIKQARVARELDADELSLIFRWGLKIELSKTEIRQYEMGVKEPDMETLELLAQILEFPISFFYKPIPQETVDSEPLFICSGIHERYVKN